MERLGTDTHELKLGRSFHRDDVHYHSIRYDFKPASVDTSKIASVDLPLGSDGGVTINVPHIEGASSTHTLFKGNIKPNPRECVLIIDHKTGEITLEKLTSNLQVKKTRAEGSSGRTQVQNARPTTPVEKQKTISPKRMKISHKSAPNTAPSNPQNKSSSNPAKKQPKSQEIVPEMSDSSSESSGSESDREDDECPPDIQQTQPSSRSSTVTKHQSKSHSGSHQQSSHSGKSSQHNQQKYALLNDDLRLSESGSDSD